MDKISSSLPCSSCVTGSVHSGTPAGVETTIHGLPTYVASPGEGVSPRAVIVMIPDAFGWKMVNNRLLCDSYAKKGRYLVYLPDFMNGAALPASFLAIGAEIDKLSPWSPLRLFLQLKSAAVAGPQLINLRASICRPKITSFFQNLRTAPPPYDTSAFKVGVAAFCWGGQFAFLFAQDPVGTRVVRHSTQHSQQGSSELQLVDCVFTAHPALIRTPKDVEAVRLPLSVCIGVEDEWMNGRDVAVMKKILDAKKAVGKTSEDAGECECQCVLLKGAKHGFAVRSWEGDSVQMGFADVAERQAFDWFERWLS